MNTTIAPTTPSPAYLAVRDRLRGLLSAGKRLKDCILLHENGVPYACLTRRALFGSVTIVNGRRWYSHASSRLEARLGLDVLRYIERVDLAEELVREFFKD